VTVIEVPRLTADTPVDAVEAALREAGCAVVERLAPDELIDSIETELAPYLVATEPGGDEFTGYRTRRTGALLARSRSFRDVAAHPLVLGALDRVLGDHATSYQLHLTQVIEIGSGEPAQYVHRDQWAFDFFPFPQGFEVECDTMWAMSEFTEENGATRVVPGSHRYEDKLRLSPDDTMPAEMPKGSVLLYVGSLYHGGGANKSTAPRRGINVGYTLSWLRQEENQYLACPPDVARELPEDIARLAGYRRGAYALGYYGDLHDPIDALRGGHETAPATFAAKNA
jgi:ectoine hydroxylase-related dioxygenase (phytanoyl-CoA dioxygenase family)